MRKLAQGSSASDPFFGMGDPILQGNDPTNRGVKRVAANPARFYRSGLADVRAVSELAPLPDTADELRAIGKVLGASPDAINLREAASELRVKTAAAQQLSRHPVRHAWPGCRRPVGAGRAGPGADAAADPDRGQRRPAHRLEIAALRLNADWVVLSACNTAAGSGQGAEALSGLARAFFYAGARALLVSHWAVYSDAAVVLTTKTFATLAASPKIGRAEAFRTAMLSLIARGQAAVALGAVHRRR